MCVAQIAATDIIALCYLLSCIQSLDRFDTVVRMSYLLRRRQKKTIFIDTHNLIWSWSWSWSWAVKAIAPVPGNTEKCTMYVTSNAEANDISRRILFGLFVYSFASPLVSGIAHARTRALTPWHPKPQLNWNVFFLLSIGSFVRCWWHFGIRAYYAYAFHLPPPPPLHRIHWP